MLTRAVVVRNSLRTGLGLATAVAVTHLFPIQHGFWVVLGAMSVLRSSALSTGTRVVRAVGGTALGFVLGAIFIHFMGVDPVVMWTVLPIVAFGSAYVPEVASFVAGQAMFTMMVLIIFNLIAPSGWQVGLIRVQDVIVGASVGIVVSLLLWPRGATASVSKAVDAALHRRLHLSEGGRQSRDPGCLGGGHRPGVRAGIRRDVGVANPG